MIYQVCFRILGNGGANPLLVSFGGRQYDTLAAAAHQANCDNILYGSIAHAVVKRHQHASVYAVVVSSNHLAIKVGEYAEFCGKATDLPTAGWV